MANSSHSFSVKRMSQQRDIRRLQLDLAYSCFTADDRKRLDLITKLFLLSILSIITSQICYLSLVIAVIYRQTNGVDKFNQGAFLVICLGIYYPTEVAFNFISLYLTNKFAASQYESCCRPFHSCCRGFMLRMAVRRILSWKHGEDIARITKKMTMQDM